jgi:phosphatidylglycerophosphatase A
VRRLAVPVATLFGVGRLPVAPATWASFVIALALIPFRGALTPWIAAALAAVLAPVAIAASHEAERTLGHDAKPIVIDEVVGMLVGAIGLGARTGTGGLAGLAALFVLFRVFDILKPWPVGRAQALPGGYGVVADDVLAGLYTALALRLLSGVLAAM